jgi:FK506-binding protein 1
MAAAAAATSAQDRLQGPGVLLRTLSPGDNQTYPKTRDVCWVHYELFLTVNNSDASPVDSSYDKCMPVRLILGAGHVIQGWEVALLKMSVGQTAEVVIPSLYGYGAAGCPPLVPGNALLIYRLHLCKIDKQR